MLLEQERARQALVASEAGALEERRIRDNLERLGQVLPNLPPAERKELIRLFVERVDVRGAKPSTRRKPQEELATTTAAAARVMEINIKLHLAELVRGMEETAMRFLGLKRKEIGLWRGPTPRLTGRFDIAMLPSLVRVENLTAALAGYGVIIVDECHHVPATSFEMVLKACSSRRVYGLTATPKRKDRLEKLLFAQCGPIRHTLVDAPTDEVRTVKVRHATVACAADAGPQPPLPLVWEALVQDESRIKVIVADLLSCMAAGRSPLVLADRKVYLDRLQQEFTSKATDVMCLRLDGQMGKKARSEVLRQIGEHYDEQKPFVLFATASLIGEGFDLPRLDTLVLAMPLSFKGRLVQYAGRLHRRHEAKASAMIFDYLDDNHAIIHAMFRRRLAGYEELGYAVEMPQTATQMRLGENRGETGIAE